MLFHINIFGIAGCTGRQFRPVECLDSQFRLVECLDSQFRLVECLDGQFRLVECLDGQFRLSKCLIYFKVSLTAGIKRSYKYSTVLQYFKATLH